MYKNWPERFEAIGKIFLANGDLVNASLFARDDNQKYLQISRDLDQALQDYSDPSISGSSEISELISGYL